MQIYIQQKGLQTGPYPIEQARAGLASGLYQPSDLAWYEGAPQWLPLSEVPGISGAVPPVIPGSGLAPGAAARSSPLAVWSLVLGILSFLLAGLTAIPAVICGHMALGRIKRSSGTLGGGGMAVAGLVIGYLGLVIFMITVLAGLTAPIIIRQKKKADQAQAISNLRQIGSGLNVFREEHENYPNVSTAVLVANETKTKPETGTSSNAYFRQLIRSNIISSETVFYAHVPGCRKPDNNIEGSHALETGECGFAYISNVSTAAFPCPIAMAPIVPGTTRFDPKPFDGKAVILWSDSSVKALPIDRKSGEVILDGRNILDPSHPVWGATPPVIAFPE
jgi:type II secretory pathway pseudopilin PulG